MITEEEKQKQDIEYVRSCVLRKFPLLGVTMSSLKTVADDNIATASTDGKTVYYSPKFFAPLSDEEKTFIYAHEVMHVAFNHIMRSKDRDMKLWNTATDAVINQILQKEGLPLIDGGVDMAEALNQSAEEMYDKLFKEKDQRQEQEQGSQRQNEQAGHDDHEIWKKAVEEAEKELQKSSDSLADKIKKMLGNTDRQNNSDNQPESSRSDAAEHVDGECDSGRENDYERNFLVENSEKRHEQAEQIRKIIEQKKNETIKARSAQSSHSFGAVGQSKAVTDWKKLLKKSIEEEDDRWSYRRSDADNDYMARVEELEEENKSETEVMLDVSGSVNESLLKEFLRQLKPILKNSTLKVGCFDHRLFDFKEIKTNRDIDNFQISGGGGTNIDMAVRAFSKKKEVNKIVFTDGYSNDMPRSDLKDMNVIWLIYDNNNFNPVCGKVIYVDEKQIANHRFISRNPKDFISAGR